MRKKKGTDPLLEHIRNTLTSPSAFCHSAEACLGFEAFSHVPQCAPLYAMKILVGVLSHTERYGVKYQFYKPLVIQMKMNRFIGPFAN